MNSVSGVWYLGMAILGVAFCAACAGVLLWALLQCVMKLRGDYAVAERRVSHALAMQARSEERLEALDDLLTDALNDKLDKLDRLKGMPTSPLTSQPICHPGASCASCENVSDSGSEGGV